MANDPRVEKQELTEVTRYFMTETDKGSSQQKDAQENNLSEQVDATILNRALRTATGTTSQQAPQASHPHIVQDSHSLLQAAISSAKREGQSPQEFIQNAVKLLKEITAGQDNSVRNVVAGQYGQKSADTQATVTADQFKPTVPRSKL